MSAIGLRRAQHRVASTSAPSATPTSPRRSRTLTRRCDLAQPRPRSSRPAPPPRSSPSATRRTSLITRRRLLPSAMALSGIIGGTRSARSKRLHQSHTTISSRSAGTRARSAVGSRNRPAANAAPRIPRRQAIARARAQKNPSQARDSTIRKAQTRHGSPGIQKQIAHGQAREAPRRRCPRRRPRIGFMAEFMVVSSATSAGSRPAPGRRPGRIRPAGRRGRRSHRTRKTRRTP